MQDSFQIYGVLGTNSGSYWLASRFIRFYDDDWKVHFGANAVSTTTLFSTGLYVSDGTGILNAKHGVRPIVYLKESVLTSGKDSSGAWQIID